MEQQQSSSSSSPKWEYDVFLSFRGDDTRHGFTDHLYHALCQRQVKTFRDTEGLPMAMPILPELITAIGKSRFAVIVLSPKFANSVSCLEEVVHILQCKELNGTEVIPVFYHIKPAKVSRQTGTYKAAFKKHDANFKNDPAMVASWRNALTEISTISGWDVPRDKSEVQVIKEIVDKITNELYSMLSDPNEELVGMDSRVKEIESCLELRSKGVLTVGIWGMGGIGKTTLAEEVYKKICNCFHPSCRFKSDVRSLSPFELVQCLCKSFLGINNVSIGTVETGIKLLKKALSTKKVLIVLDDVVSFNQIKCLAPPAPGPLGQNIWGAGSRLIITTRDRSSLMRKCNANACENYLYEVEKLRVYEVRKLTDDEARQLLCQEAYKSEILPEEFEALSESFLQYAGGIPLALKVLASYLSRFPVDCWSEILHRLDDDGDEDIYSVLQESFDGLQDTEKKIFLDIACFFYGEELVRVQNILSGFDYACPQAGIMNLVFKSLIKIEKGRLQMHDLLRCLCWHIVRDGNKDEPGNRRRLWVDDNTPKYDGISSWRFEDARNVLMDDMGTNAVEGLLLNLHEKEEMSLDNDPFLKMGGLRLLKLYNVKFLGVHLTHVSRNLRVIEWHECPLQTLPDNFKWVNLVEIKMPNSRIMKLWNGQPSLGKLKVVDLSHCHFLSRTPNFNGVRHLEILILQGCNELSELHLSIWELEELKCLNLEDCTSLHSLPQYISMKSLQIFILSGCSSLQKFPEIGENMDMLTELYLDGTAIQELPVSFKYLKGLILLNLCGCSNLLSLQSILCSLTSLKFLHLSLCSCMDSPLENIVIEVPRSQLSLASRILSCVFVVAVGSYVYARLKLEGAIHDH